MAKRIALALKFYKYRQRLEYKCKAKGIKYKVINEYYTSKMCSVCGEIDDKLGGKKIYKCVNCKSVMDRDVNGCRGIYIKQYM